MTFFGVRHEGDVGHESGVGEPARQPRFVHLEPLLVAAWRHAVLVHRLPGGDAALLGAACPQEQRIEINDLSSGVI